MGDPQKVPGSWLQIGSALAIAAIWGANQWMEDLSVSPSLCESAFPINITESLKKKSEFCVYFGSKPYKGLVLV